MQLLEREKRLSESILWQLQLNAYTQFGPSAWSQKGVPFYVTSNPFTANSYAQIIYAFLKDIPLQLDEPLYILDLGAGTGRFAYLFLKEFLPLLANSPLSKLRIRYVLTDIVNENFTFWQNHDLLKPYFEEGILSFSYYHHTQENAIVSDGPNPLVLIANYFFDTIPQDLFRVKDGELEEGYISLYTSKPFTNPEDPQIINDLTWEFTFAPVNEIPANYKEFLRYYQKNLQEATFLFPSGAMQTLEYFKKISNNNLFLIAGDQGVATLEQIQTWQPKLALHGSFSIAVSYHTLAKYFEQNYGKAFLSHMSDPAFVVMAGVLSRDKQSYYETKNAFHSFVDAFEPQDYWRLGIEMEKANSSLEAILLLIKLGRFDPMNLYGFYGVIRKELPFASAEIKERLAYTISKVEENFFPIGKEDGAFIANLGVLCFDLKRYHQALVLFEKAILFEGTKEYLLSNIRACKTALSKTRFI